MDATQREIRSWMDSHNDDWRYCGENDQNDIVFVSDHSFIKVDLAGWVDCGQYEPISQSYLTILTCRVSRRGQLDALRRLSSKLLRLWMKNEKEGVHNG